MTEATAKEYITLPFVPMTNTSKEAPPPPIPLVPIEGAALWGEPLTHSAYREYQNSDGSIERLYWDDCRIKLTYTPPSDGVWNRKAAPDNEHITQGEDDMTTDLPPDDLEAGASREEAERWTDQLLYTPPVPHTPASEEPAHLTTYLEYLSTIKTVFATLKANGTHKQVGIALALLSANWLGGMLYHMVPFSGVPMTVGMLCLCSLVLRSNRERLMKVIKEYVE